jgi:hypothetical protein
VEGLRTDVARLALRVVRARLDGLRDGLLVFFVGVVLFCVAAAVNPFTNLLVAAAPVVMLASGVAVASVTSNASRRGVGQWGGAGGAVCEDHLAFCGELLGLAGLTRLEKPEFFNLTKKTLKHATRRDALRTPSTRHEKNQPYYTAPISPRNSDCAADSFL